MHSPSFSPLCSPEYCISGKVEVHGSGSPSVPAPSAVLPPQSPVNPKPCGTFSWPTSKSPFTPFLPAASLLHSSKLLRESSALLLHLAFQLDWAATVNPGRCGPMAWSQSSPSSHVGAVTRGSCLPVTSWVEVTSISLDQSTATAI